MVLSDKVERRGEEVSDLIGSGHQADAGVKMRWGLFESATLRRVDGRLRLF